MRGLAQGQLRTRGVGSKRTAPSRPAISKQSCRPSRYVARTSCALGAAQAGESHTERQNLHSAAIPQGLRPNKSLWGTSQHVQLVGVEEAEELYLALVQRTNEQHVLMVLYAPWCTHCQSIEQEVEKLAAGLSHQRDLVIVALNVDPPAARYFSKEVLGVTTLPGFVLFPRESRTFYKYKGRGRDAPSILKFLNMVCNQSSDQVWQLNGAAAQSQRSLTQAIQAGTTALPKLDSISTYPGWMAGVLGVLGVAVLAKFFHGRNLAHQAFAAAAAGGVGPASPTTQLKQEIDGTMGRMGGLMVKLAGARVGLGVLEATGAVSALPVGGAAALPAAATTAEDTATAAPAAAATVDVQAQPAEAPPTTNTTSTTTADVHSVSTSADPAAPAQHVDDTEPVRTSSPSESSASQSAAPAAAAAAAEVPPAALPPAATAVATAATAVATAAAPAAVSATVSAPVAGAEADALSQEEVNAVVGSLDTQELLRLLDEESNDVDKVVQRLLKAEAK